MPAWYWPAAHRAQPLEPAPAAKAPIPQLTHAAALAPALKLPAAHAVQRESPEALYWPAPHVTHAVLPSPLSTVPAAQVAHCVAPTLETRPMLQLPQKGPPVTARYMPAAHGVQLAAPAAEYAAAGQSRHPVAAEPAYLPAAQLTHRAIWAPGW